MKNQFTLGMLMLGATLASNAQITLTQNDFNNWMGATIVQAIDTTNIGVHSPGNSGANQTWNLSGFSNDTLETMQVLNPATTPCSANFPGATYAIGAGFGNMFMTLTSSALEFLGGCGVFFPPDTLIMPYTPPQIQIAFPATYNSTFSGQTLQVLKFAYNPPPPDSVRVVSNISYSNVMDGWGNVTIPTGTFPCLRGKNIKYKTDSTFVYTSGAWQFSGQPPSIDTMITYDWWVNNNFPVATLETNGSGQITKASYLLQSSIGIEKARPEISSAFIFPNPASESITISSLKSDAKRILITDITGRKMMETHIHQKSVTIPVHQFAKGIYLYQLIDEKGGFSENGKFLVE